jgi:hypothetical protein
MKPTTYLFSNAQTKEMVNGKITQYTNLTTEYDGKVLKMDECNKDKCGHYIIKNKELKNLKMKKRKTVLKKTKKRLPRNRSKTKKRY